MEKYSVVRDDYRRTLVEAAISFRFWSEVVGYVAAVWLACLGNLAIIEMWIPMKLNKPTKMNSNNTKAIL